MNIGMTTLAALALAVASQARAQNKPTAATPVPFYATARIEPLSNGTPHGDFDKLIPVGMRLVVHYVGVQYSASNASLAVESVCQIFGHVDDRSTPNAIQEQKIPVQRLIDPRSDQLFLTAGQQMTMFIEPGAIAIQCFGGRDGAGTATLTGELVAK